MLNQNSFWEILRSESLNVRSLLIYNYIFQPFLFHVHKNLPSTRADVLRILMHKNLRIVSAGNLMSYHILSAYFLSSTLQWGPSIMLQNTAPWYTIWPK